MTQLVELEVSWREGKVETVRSSLEAIYEENDVSPGKVPYKQLLPFLMKETYFLLPELGENVIGPYVTTSSRVVYPSRLSRIKIKRVSP